MLPLDLFTGCGGFSPGIVFKKDIRTLNRLNHPRYLHAVSSALGLSFTSKMRIGRSYDLPIKLLLIILETQY